LRNFSASPLPDDGEKCYNQALEALKKVEEIRNERERKKSEEMYKAWQKAEEKQKQHANNKKAENLKGVAVVKTIVKQTRKELKGKVEKKDTEEFLTHQAEKLLKEAAFQHGHPQALILLANDELKKANAALEKDKAESERLLKSALDMYQRAGNQNSAEGWFNFGQLLWTGYPSMDSDDGTRNGDKNTFMIMKPDLKASMEAFRNGIDLGDPDAMYFVGVQYLSEDEGNKAGLELIQSAADLGHGPARYYLALLHLNGNEPLGIVPCSAVDFVRYLNAATETGNSDALFLRGHCYHEGDSGYPRDYKLALDDFIASAEGGNADAAVSAGAVLHSGRPGVKQDQKRAFELYQLAGEMGSIEGWRNVIACYALGEGVPKSEATAKYIAKTMLKDG
jgi:TPR repeat protein